jgi:dolichyl-phosphate beta-glucosyltransferase
MPTEDFQLSVVIPAYNEDSRIGPTLQELDRYLGQLLTCELVLVDDGSTDNTVQTAQSAVAHSRSFRIIRLNENQGKGAAVRAGILHSSGSSIFVVDADLPYRLDAFDKALEYLESGAEVIIGARDHSQSEIDASYPRYRSIAGRWFSRIVNWQVPVQVFDTQCGFKAFRQDVAKELFQPLQTRRYAYDIELLLRARLAGRRVEMIPVKLARQHGSRVRFFRDSIRMLEDLRKIRRMYLRGELYPRRVAKESSVISHRSSVIGQDE